MSSMEMMAASLAFGGLQMMGQNNALEAQQAQRDETARRQIEELARQQERADQVAAEEKSEVAREFDLAMGTLIAAGADGGVTSAGLARSGGAAGAVAGLDMARIESNRQEGQSARRADGLSTISENSAQRKATQMSITNNTIGFFGNAAGTVSNYAYRAEQKKTPVVTTKRSTDYTYT